MDDLTKSENHYNLRQYHSKPSSWWLQEKERVGLDLFHRASQHVPAYRDFLHNNNINPKKIRFYQDLESVPPVTKENYLRRYPMESLCWHGTIDKQLMYCSTSGSTGSPYYFPRNRTLDWQNSYVLENFINQSNCQGPILAIICFGMGVWIGGVLNYSAFQILQSRDSRPISIIAPGINKQEIMQILLTLAPSYREVILLGYPPFIKDLFDSCIHNGIKIDEINFKLIFAAECVTEEFRDHVCQQAGIENPIRDVINIYGSADIGGMAVEGPAGIAIRRLARSNNNLFSEFFPTNKSATVAQYNPHFINFDCDQGKLLITGDSALPLIRYSLGDRGGIFSFDQADALLQNYKINLMNFSRDAGIKNLERLPFVYVYERVDFSVKFYGAIIYPEYIRPAVQKEIFKDNLTGRFCIEMGESQDRDQLLNINVELKLGAMASVSLETELASEIKKSLTELSSEFANNASILGEKVNPVVRFWQYGHEKYFEHGIKQKWIKRTTIAS